MNPTAIHSKASMPSLKVEISVQCRNLKDTETVSKPDPMCVLHMLDAKSRQLHEVGQTEGIKDTLNPDFAHKFVIDYCFEEKQMLTFSIYDVDLSSKELKDFLGKFECFLGELVGTPARTEKPLKGCGKGTIILHCEEVHTSKEEVTLQLQAVKLDKKDLFGKSDPFLLVHRVNDDHSFTVVNKTEVVKNNLNPVWKPFTVSVQALCNGNYGRSIQIECYDWDSDGSHDFIGSFTTNLQELKLAGQERTRIFPVINSKKQSKKKSYKDSGQIHVMSCNVRQCQSFLDYIKGGLQINFTVAIDFTASNGIPSHHSSLHYMNPCQPNQYAAVIQAVGEIIQDYDTDKMFSALGFGAKLPNGVLSHDFAVNFNPSNPCCNGVNGILQAYQEALPKLQLCGPTNFAPIINHVARAAASATEGSHYFVLLIITDGEITDFHQTKSAIVAASRLPISIIIVGVGNAEFDAMDVLDSDNCLLRDTGGNMAERDIVQFVPFRDFLGGRNGTDISQAKTALAKEVLAEIPDQVLDYMRKHNIQANTVSIASASASP